MKFKIAYWYISGIFFGLFMEYGHEFYINFKTSFLAGTNSIILLTLFYFMTGFLVPYIVGIYYTIQLAYNQFLSNKFYPKEEND